MVAETAVVTLDQPVVPASLSGAAKGIAYILFERLGSVPTSDVAHLFRNMHESDKPILARLGLRFGVETVYMPEMLKPAKLICVVFYGRFMKRHFLMVRRRQLGGRY